MKLHNNDAKSSNKQWVSSKSSTNDNNTMKFDKKFNDSLIYSTCELSNGISTSSTINFIILLVLLIIINISVHIWQWYQ